MPTPLVTAPPGPIQLSFRGGAKLLLRFLVLARPLWPRFFRVLIGASGALGLALVAPLITKEYFDSVLPSHDTYLLAMLVGGAFLLAVTSAFVVALRSYLSAVIEGELATAVATMLFNHLQHQRLQFFEGRRIGELAARIAEARAIAPAISRILQASWTNAIYLTVVPIVLVQISGRLAVIAAVAPVINAVANSLIGSLIRRRARGNVEAYNDLAATQIECFSQIRTVKGLAAEASILSRVRALSEYSLSYQLRSTYYTIGLSLGTSVVTAAGAAVFAWYAWHQVLAGELSPGGFLAFSAYLGYFVGPLSQVTSLVADFNQAAVTLHRTFEYLDINAEADPSRSLLGKTYVGRSRGDLVLEDVSFAYDQGPPVLAAVDARFPARSFTVITGESGAGKSTLLRLLARIDLPTRGHIKLDDRSINLWALHEYRSEVGIVWQDPSLFRGTLRDNLTLGAAGAPDDELLVALEDCELGELLAGLPEGLDTSIAEWGATLSGGQRQRLALARALIADTRVLLLDEATSQLDHATEARILTAMRRWALSRTIVLCTHRPAALRLADQVLTLRAGCVEFVPNDHAGQRPLACDASVELRRPREPRVGPRQ